ncbi:hypothetical protein AVEN_30580-1 [Araneus ventricosus]|uniref:Uncharacterized protein n=1 Tax=Araneus ventricosus TaxID=182803 RepID=A0A4Y2ERH6_ARAVE|nr:hypothetical protein AVEN_30580-1 [Araneus ventricosus]
MRNENTVELVILALTNESLGQVKKKMSQMEGGTEHLSVRQWHKWGNIISCRVLQPLVNCRTSDKLRQVGAVQPLMLQPRCTDCAYTRLQIAHPGPNVVRAAAMTGEESVLSTIPTNSDLHTPVQR